MSTRALIRAGGTAAVVGGLLRAVASFAPGIGTDAEHQLLYLLTDVFLMLGLVGFFGLRHKAMGRIGAVGFVLALAGLLIVRSSREISGLNLYPSGALAFATGLIAMCICAWRARVLPGWIPLTLLVSALLGALTIIVNGAAWLFTLSGVLFGVAYVGLGAEVRAGAEGV